MTFACILLPACIFPWKPCESILTDGFGKYQTSSRIGAVIYVAELSLNLQKLKSLFRLRFEKSPAQVWSLLLVLAVSWHGRLTCCHFCRRVLGFGPFLDPWQQIGGSGSSSQQAQFLVSLANNQAVRGCSNGGWSTSTTDEKGG